MVAGKTGLRHAFSTTVGTEGRRLALVDEPQLRLLEEWASVYDMAQACASARQQVTTEVNHRLFGETLDYDEVYSAASEWRILLSADHPNEPTRCLVSGTGLTHTASARTRQAMHRAHRYHAHVSLGSQGRQAGGE